MIHYRIKFYFFNMSQRITALNLRDILFVSTANKNVHVSVEYFQDAT